MKPPTSGRSGPPGDDKGNGPSGARKSTGPRGDRRASGPPGDRKGSGPPGDQRASGAPPGGRKGGGPPGDYRGSGAPGDRKGSGPGGDHRASGPAGDHRASGPPGDHRASGPPGRRPPPDRIGSGPRGAFHGSNRTAKPAEARTAAPLARIEAPKPERPILRAVTPPAPPPPTRPPQAQITRGQLRGAQGAAAPKGTVWIYGLHAVAAALANPNRRLRRLLLTEEAEATLAAEQPTPWPLAHERAERSRIDQMLGRDVVHQGIALLADPLAPPLLAKVMERPGPFLVLDQVTDPRNIGAILRSAAAFGVAAVITQDRNAPEETGAMAKAASGAMETVPLLRAVNLARTLVALKAAGCWVVGLDAGSARLDGAALGQRRVALVLGAEHAGLRRLTRDTCDELAGLQMPGVMESLNVSAAAAVALYELARTEP